MLGRSCLSGGRQAATAALVLGTTLLAADAGAFCGFFVSGADAALSNNASQVVLLRKGNHTVLSMSNNYKGPPQDFAMVVPVPVILQKDQVKTLSADVFKRVDQLSAPRLVEYWEQDPATYRRRLPSMSTTSPAPSLLRRLRRAAAPAWGSKSKPSSRSASTRF
jgi:hypothetical protein